MIHDLRKVDNQVLLTFTEEEPHGSMVISGEDILLAFGFKQPRDVEFTPIGAVPFKIEKPASATVGFLPPDKRDSLVVSSDTVVAGVIVHLDSEPDYSASENLNAGAPADPKNGYHHHITIKVESLL